jgi:hypothetical protein
MRVIQRHAQLAYPVNIVQSVRPLKALRYGVGSGGYNATTGQFMDRGLGSSRLCCGPRVDPALQPCSLERCPFRLKWVRAEDWYQIASLLLS